MMKNDNLRFSIRKLTIGVVSVMFGALLFGMIVHPVHADTTDKLSNGLESQTAVSAKNKNTNQVTTIKAANNNQAIYNSTVATDGQFTITIANKTNASQTLIGGYNIYNLPA